MNKVIHNKSIVFILLVPIPQNFSIEKAERIIDEQAEKGAHLKELPVYKQIVGSLENILRTKYPSAKCHLFGSRLLGVANEQSELDIHIDLRKHLSWAVHIVIPNIICIIMQWNPSMCQKAKQLLQRLLNTLRMHWRKVQHGLACVSSLIVQWSVSSRCIISVKCIVTYRSVYMELALLFIPPDWSLICSIFTKPVSSHVYHSFFTMWNMYVCN